MVSIMRYIMRTPIHFLACKDVRLTRPFLSTYRWRNGHRSGLNLPEWFKPTGDCGYDAPIVPDGVTLSSVQQWFVDLYQQSEGWYLLPPWHFMNMAQACMLAFGLCLILLLVMSGAWALKLARGK
nr:disulfide bond formation protein B [Salmonella enterica]